MPSPPARLEVTTSSTRARSEVATPSTPARLAVVMPSPPARSEVTTSSTPARSEVATPSTPARLEVATPSTPARPEVTTPSTRARSEVATPSTRARLAVATPSTPARSEVATPLTPARLEVTTLSTPARLEVATPSTPARLEVATPSTPARSEVTTPSTRGRENDSGYEASDRGTSTDTLTPTDQRHREYFGRAYHAGPPLSYYPYPNDEAELERLKVQHDLSLLLLDEKLFLAPLSHPPSNVLDIGTGAGKWAIDFADEYPSSIVLGTDICAIQERWVPPNCSFVIDDASDGWTFAFKFDFIHVRQLQGCLEENRLFRQAFNALQPGGWLEIAEMSLPLICNNSEKTALQEWSENMMEASRILQKPLDKPYYYQQWLEQAGFINVTQFIQDVDLNPRNKDLKEVSEHQKRVLLEGFEAFSLYMYIDVLGWHKEELEVHLALLRKEVHIVPATCRWFRYTAQKQGN